MSLLDIGTKLLDQQIARTVAVTKERDCLRAQQTVLVRAVQRFIDVDNADKCGQGLISAQGQGMDGFTKLANYGRCVEKARKALATLDVPDPKEG